MCSARKKLSVFVWESGHRKQQQSQNHMTRGRPSPTWHVLTAAQVSVELIILAYGVPVAQRESLKLIARTLRSGVIDTR